MQCITCLTSSLHIHCFPISSVHVAALHCGRIGLSPLSFIPTWPMNLIISCGYLAEKSSFIYSFHSMTSAPLTRQVLLGPAQSDAPGYTSSRSMAVLGLVSVDVRHALIFHDRSSWASMSTSTSSVLTCTVKRLMLDIHGYPFAHCRP